MIKNTNSLLLLVIFCVTLAFVNSQPTSSYWIGGSSGSFHFFENWNPEGIPSVDDTVYINTTNAVVTSKVPNSISIYAAYIGQDNSSVQFILNSVVTISNYFEIESGSSVSTYPFTLTSGNLMNFGQFNITGTTFNANITNSGVFEIDNNATFNGNGYYSNGQLNAASAVLNFNSEITLTQGGKIQASSSNLNIKQDIVLDDSSSIQLVSSVLNSNNNVFTLGSESSLSAIGDSEIILGNNEILLIEESSILISSSNLTLLQASNLTFNDNSTASFTTSSRVVGSGQWSLYENSSLSFAGGSNLNVNNFVLNLNGDSNLGFDQSSLLANTSTTFNLYDNSQIQSNSQLFIFDTSSINLQDNSQLNINGGVFVNTTFNLNSTSIFSSSGIIQTDNIFINGYGSSTFKVVSNDNSFGQNTYINFNDQSILSITGFVSGISSVQFNDTSQFNIVNGELAFNSSNPLVFEPTTTFSSQNSKVTFNSAQGNFGIFTISGSSLIINNSTFGVFGQYSITSSSISTYSNGALGASFKNVSLSGNKGSITFSDQEISLSLTKLSMTAGNATIVAPTLYASNSTFSLSNQCNIGLFSPVVLMGSSALNNAGFLAINTNVNNGLLLNGSISNSGIVVTPSGSKLTFMTHFTNTGNSTFNQVHIANYTQSKTGITILTGANALFSSDNPIIINGGQFYGNGTINAPVNALNGTIGSATQLNNIIINGEFTLSPNATLQLTIASVSSLSNFKVNGVANLQGSLTVFVLQPIEKNINITIVEFSQIVGNFTSIQFNLPESDSDDSNCQQIFYTETGFIVNFASACGPPNKLSAGAIAGIVIGSFAFVAILAFGGYFGYKYYQSKKGGYSPILSK